MDSSPHIDRQARNQLAAQLRHYAAGVISNDTLEDRLPASPDPAVRQVFTNGAWPHYDDLRDYFRTGSDRMDRDQRRHFALMILFLKTDLPYRWPATSGLRYLPWRLLSCLTLGWFGQVWIKRHWREGNRAAWPFFTADELAVAKSKFPYPVASS